VEARSEGGRDLPRRLQEDAAAQHLEADARTRSAPSAAQPVARRGSGDRRRSCHKFDVAGHEGYIHVGFYEDGYAGEIFIKMAKEGSTISG
jgi:ribonucleoside-diphosphate reductase alpha chain